MKRLPKALYGFFWRYPAVLCAVSPKEAPPNIFQNKNRKKESSTTQQADGTAKRKRNK